jgi:SsrA-binding protein
MKVENRKARRDYNVLECHEAGIVLHGQEVKSIRDGEVSLSDSFCKIHKGELFVIGMHISHYGPSREMLEPKRQRKLLLHRGELNRLITKVYERGFALIPLRLYINSRGIVKLEIALCHGKRKHDKRETIKKRDLEREMKAEG